jgi:carbon monoxide dehydrogenase subunit G
MRLEQSFAVAAGVDDVWAALIDVERVAPCLPGAEVTGRDADGAYAGAFTVKIGPTTAAYAGRLVMESVDPVLHVATMRAAGTDKRGQGGARATIVSRVSADDGVTRVDIDTEYAITGKPARFGRGGMVEDIASKLLLEFGTRLQESLAVDGAVSAGSAPAGESGAAAAAARPAPVAAAASPPPAPVAAAAAAPPPPRAAIRAAEPLDAGALVGAAVRERARENAPLLAGLFVLLLLLSRSRRRRRR